MVSGDFFSSLMMLCYCPLYVLRHSVHWNCCTEEMRSLLDLLEVEGSLARKLRFPSLQLVEIERSFARKLRFNIFNSWNLKEASHESFVFISSTLGIRRKPCTKACVLQFNVCRSQCNGFVKCVPRGSCMRNTISFCS